MNAYSQQLKAPFTVVWTVLSAKQTAVCLAAVLALLGGSVAWSTNQQWEPLDANLDPADAAKIRAELDRAGVPYQIEGGQILVARNGLAGFDLLTLTTDEKERLYHRELAGEIARGLKTIAGVADADVKLCIPEEQAFDEEQPTVTAAVMLTLSSEKIDEQQVRTVVKYVTGAVPGLKRENITVCDQWMRALTPENGNGAGPELEAMAPAERER